MSGLPPGRVEVIARAPGHRAARSARLQLTAGLERSGVELVLGIAGRIAARVLDEHGRPADARIEARIEEDPVPRTLETDARGVFSLEDVGGTVLEVLDASAPGADPVGSADEDEDEASAAGPIAIAVDVDEAEGAAAAYNPAP